MLANPDKFQTIVLCPDRQDTFHINFDITGNCIGFQAHINLLGVELDSELEVDMHISNLCRKAESDSYMF